MNSFRIFPVSLFILLFVIGGCVVVKQEEEPDYTPPVILSPKPDIEMSDELIRSKAGDMIAFLPKNWFLIDVKDKVSSDVIAVAVNPDYTLSAVFSHIKTSEQIDKTFEKEGLLGLARISLARHERKTAGGLKQVGKYNPISMGKNRFVKYEFSSTAGALISRVAVFASSRNDFYEFALIPMDINGSKVPPSEEFDRIFRSILTTINF